MSYRAAKGRSIMPTRKRMKVLATLVLLLTATAVVVITQGTSAQQQQRPSSYMPVIEEPFEVVRTRDKAAKAGVMAAHLRLLDERYDLTRRVDESVRMTRGKPRPVGPTAKLRKSVTWEHLGQMTPDQLKERD